MEMLNACSFETMIGAALGKFETGETEDAKKMFMRAEAWLHKVSLCEEFLKMKDSAVPDKLPGRWLDHREAVLFQAYRKIKDFAGAQRIIDAMQDTPHALSVKSKEGRIAVLKKETEAAQT